MDYRNDTWVNEFILLGFSYPAHIKIVLFAIILAIYLLCLTANSLFITVTLLDSRLHSPMYFFLCNLSFLDICYSSVGGPTVLKGFFAHRITLSYHQCITQMYFGLAFGQTECILLAMMAWDRYVAICYPLNYHQIVTGRVCINLAIATWATGFMFALSSVVTIPWVTFCGGNIIDHTVCEADALSRLICHENHLSDFITYILSLFMFEAPVCLIVFTYFKIVSTILRIPGTESRHRAFSTCGTHLMVVTLFYGTAMVIYLEPKSAVSSEKDKSMSLFYGLVVPATNPLIYTLRNKEVKGALKKLYMRNIFL